MKLPYGGFSIYEHERINGVKDLYEQSKDGMEPWDRLHEIQQALYHAESLKDGRLAIKLPSELAAWLGAAIEYSHRDDKEFCRQLGLAARRGAPGSPFHPWAMAFGERIAQIEEDQHINTQEAIAHLIEELGVDYSDLEEDPNFPSVSTLTRYRKEYEKARNVG
jgi:hypothetical protein